MFGNKKSAQEKALEKERKKYGQFFTSMETARFMSGLYNFDENTDRQC